MNARERATQGFRQRFNDEPTVVARAPGRVNLIGEHVDYSGGLVLPIAIDLDVVVAARARSDGKINAFAVDSPDDRWHAYVNGVAELMGVREGADLVIAGDVPLGGGLSSSAALEVSTATALRALFDIPLEQKDLALLCQRAENEYAGVPCGIMDQFASALTHAQHALLLDCRSLHVEHVPLPEEIVLVVADSGVPRTLAGSKYQERFDECAAAARIFGVAMLRDALDRDVSELPEPLRKRARHVISEIKRVQQFDRAMRSDDVDTAGDLLYESHASLRDDFEVSVPELDKMVELVGVVDGVYGSRLTGAGFGGCTVTMCARDAADDVREILRGHRTWRVTAAEGASVL